MSQIDRLYKYKTLLSGRRAMSAQDLMQALEVSPATFKRDLAKLRDQLHVPIRFDRDRGGYVLEQGHTDSELPGLWFNADELLALLTIDQLLQQLAPGLLGPKLRPLQQRLTDLVSRQGVDAAQVQARVKVLHAGKRRVELQAFEQVAHATMARQRLRITHHNRATDQTTQRTVSPQQLVHYRDNWYLDAWCHLRGGLRSFSIDAITHAQPLDEPAQDVDPAQIQATMAASYGIFNGPPKAWAHIKISPTRARWVSREQWHPQQKTWTDAQGWYHIEVPYADERELIGDVLKFGADAEVVGPEELRKRVGEVVVGLVGRYLG